jgi:hypothetical protein
MVVLTAAQRNAARPFCVLVVAAPAIPPGGL